MDVSWAGKFTELEWPDKMYLENLVLLLYFALQSAFYEGRCIQTN